MFTNTPSDRVQVVGRGDLLHPGSCALCGSGNCDEGYVNTGIYYDYEGQVYFCITCTRQIAEVIGCLIPEEANILREQVNEVAKTNKNLTEQLEAANERLRAIDIAFGALNLTTPNGNPFSVVTDPIDEPVVKVDEPITGSANDGEPETPKPIALKRRSNTKQSELRDVAAEHNGIEL